MIAAAAAAAGERDLGEREDGIQIVPPSPQGRNPPPPRSYPSQTIIITNSKLGVTEFRGLISRDID